MGGICRAGFYQIPLWKFAPKLFGGPMRGVYAVATLLVIYFIWRDYFRLGGR